jgi:hypothetical protein
MSTNTYKQAADHIYLGLHPLNPLSLAWFISKLFSGLDWWQHDVTHSLYELLD